MIKILIVGSKLTKILIFLIGLSISICSGCYWASTVEEKYTTSVLVYFTPYEIAPFLTTDNCSFGGPLSRPTIKQLFSIMKGKSFFLKFATDNRLKEQFFAKKNNQLDTSKYDTIQKKWKIVEPKDIEVYKVFFSRLNVREMETPGLIKFSYTDSSKEDSSKVLLSYLSAIRHFYLDNISDNINGYRERLQEIKNYDDSVFKKNFYKSVTFDVSVCSALFMNNMFNLYPVKVFDEPTTISSFKLRNRAFYFIYSIVFYCGIFLLFINVFYSLKDDNVS